MNNLFKKIIKALASLELAFVIILGIAALTAWGTIVEAKFDATAAAKIVYRTWYMYSALGLLAISLIAVMVDRWPWKKRHIPFLLAHVGILVLLLGSVITFKYGLDGSMRFGVGEKNRFVVIPDTEITVWSSFDGDRFSKVFEQGVDFFTDSPKEKPFQVQLIEGEFKVVDYMPYALASRQIQEAKNEKAGAAARFQLKNDRVNVNEWLLQPKPGQLASQNFGPAQVHLGPAPAQARGQNEIFLTPNKKGSIDYTVYFHDPARKALKGEISEGGSFQPGWMGLEFKLLRYFPSAKENWEFKALKSPTPLSTAAVRIQFMNHDQWIQLNDVIKIFTSNAAYIISYANRRIDIGFDLFLKKFEVGRYQGTMRAASYQSLVSTPDGAETLISMNEPLKHNGLTFYQASFQESPDGTPTASVLSVNYDPGRWIKYLGSLILSLGVVWLFYNKRKSARAQAPKQGSL